MDNSLFPVPLEEFVANTALYLDKALVTCVMVYHDDKIILLEAVTTTCETDIVVRPDEFKTNIRLYLAEAHRRRVVTPYCQQFLALALANVERDPAEALKEFIDNMR